jgi:hypothetical protein
MEPQTRELTTRVLPLSDGARTILVSFADVIEVAQAPGGNLAHVTGSASKAAEQAARMAGVLTLWRDLDAREVKPGDMKDAIALAQFYLGDAARLATFSTVSVEFERAEELRKWLLDSWQHSEVMARDVVQHGPNPLRETSKARAALVCLERHGWLVPLELRKRGARGGAQGGVADCQGCR